MDITDLDLIDDASRPPVRTAVVESVRRVFDDFFKIDEAIILHSKIGGGVQRIKRLSVERGDSVAVMPVDRVGRVVWLTEQFRYPTLAKGPGWIEELPAGMAIEGESNEDAARRETSEETGFTNLTLEHVSTFYASPGGTSERIVLFCAFVDGASRDPQISETTRDAEEDIGLITVDLEDFFRRAVLGELNDAKTLIGGLWLLANRQRLGI